MPRSLRTRSRLLIAFLAVHLILVIGGGVVAWRLLDGYLMAQAEASARRVGEVLAVGGFTVNERNRELMERLTGFPFRLDPPGPAASPGTVRAQVAGRTVAIDYRGPAYRHASSTLLAAVGAAAVIGVLAFAAVAWLVARHLARPLETLAASTRRIGQGSWDEPVPAVGGGEVRDLARDLDLMRRYLHQLDTANRRAERLAVLGTFTATIAHEVRNPLSAVRLTVQMLRRQHADDPGVALITDELERLDLTVDELLAFSCGMHVDPAPCALDTVAADVFRLLRRQAEHAGVTITVTGRARVHADAARLRQMLLNLVLNAIQVQHGGGSVRIVVEDDGLTIDDDGPGVPAEILPHLFDAFTSRRAGGSGLGLHLAKAIADAHGADLRCINREGGGACFVLRGLPPAE